MSRSCDSAVTTSVDIPQGECHLSLVLSGHGCSGTRDDSLSVTQMSVRTVENATLCSSTHDGGIKEMR